MASVGSILGGAFRLFREQPFAILTWIVIFALYGFATNGAAMGGGAIVDAEALRSGAMSPLNAVGAVFFVMLLGLAFNAVMLCAVYRVVLRTDERSFAGLRLGMDELRMFGLFLIFIVAAVFLVLVIGLMFVMMAGGTMYATGGGAGTVLLMILLWLGMFVGFVYFGVRLSLVAPMTFLRRRIAIDDGWRLTAGHFWTLFFTFVVIAVLCILIYCVAVLPFAGPFFGEFTRAFTNPEGFRSAQAAEASALASQPLVTTLLLIGLSAVVQGIAHALNAGAAATAVREILHEEGEYLDDEVEATAQIFE